jgi:hypothetical protein
VCAHVSSVEGFKVSINTNVYCAGAFSSSCLQETGERKTKKRRNKTECVDLKTLPPRTHLAAMAGDKGGGPPAAAIALKDQGNDQSNLKSLNALRRCLGTKFLKPQFLKYYNILLS